MDDLLPRRRGRGPGLDKWDRGAEDSASMGAFVGRKTEMAELGSALDDAAAGRGRLALVVGEPGIGKTRIAQQVAIEAEDRDFLVLIGRCYEGEGAPAYWPWIQIVRAYARGRNDERLLAELGSGAPDIAEIVPDIRDRFPELLPLPARDPEQGRFRLFDSFTAFLEKASRSRPLVLVVDDLHSADRASLQLLQFLARELGDAAILVLATYRDIELGRRHPLTQTLGELAREQRVRRLLLKGLSPEEVARYIESTTGMTPPYQLVAELSKQTDGNPFFVTEVVQLLAFEDQLAERHDLGGWNLEIPHSVREVIGRRLDALSEDCQHVLTIAAVVGTDFSSEVLGHVTDVSAERLLELLDEGAGARIVNPIGKVGRYRFSHGLIRETLYAEISTPSRVRLHRDVGEAIEAVVGESDARLNELAYHFFEAAQGGTAEKAIEYLRRAARYAMSVYAPEEASKHCERALQLFEVMPQPDQSLRFELLMELATAQGKGGDPAIDRTCLLAVDVARELGSVERMARAALKVGGEFALLGTPLVLEQQEKFVGVLEEILENIPSDDSPLRAKVLAHLSRALAFETGDRAHQLAREAIEIVKRTGDPDAVAAATASVWWGLWKASRSHELSALTDQLVRRARESGDHERMLHLLPWRITELLERGDLEAAEAAIGVFFRTSQELRLPFFLWSAALFQATLAFLHGRLDEGARLLSEGLASSRQESQWAYQSIFAAAMRPIWWERGEYERLETSEVVKRFPNLFGVRVGLGLIEFETGRTKDAQKAFEQLSDDDFAGLSQTPLRVFELATVAQLCCRVGNVPGATRLYDLMLPYDGRNIMQTPPLGICEGPVSLRLGQLATTLGRFDDAERHFLDSLAMCDRLDARVFRAHTQFEWAKMLVAREDRKRALSLVSDALATADEIGMTVLARKSRELKMQLQGLDPAEMAPPSPGSTEPAAFRRLGDFWTITFNGIVTRLRDTKGLQYLARLLSSPDTEVHVSDLVGSPRDSDLGAVLDPQAKTAYRRRLEDLRDEIEEAEANTDDERAAKAREELDSIAAQLSDAVYGGRDRKAGSASERQRVAVAKAIKLSLKKIGESNPQLGRHLENSIRTGYFCSYTPEHPVAWAL